MKLQTLLIWRVTGGSRGALKKVGTEREKPYCSPSLRDGWWKGTAAVGSIEQPVC